jgi:hypothetical protein
MFMTYPIHPQVNLISIPEDNIDIKRGLDGISWSELFGAR